MSRSPVEPNREPLRYFSWYPRFGSLAGLGFNLIFPASVKAFFATLFSFAVIADLHFRPGDYVRFRANLGLRVCGIGGEVCIESTENSIIGGFVSASALIVEATAGGYVNTLKAYKASKASRKAEADAYAKLEARNERRRQRRAEAAKVVKATPRRGVARAAKKK